MQRYSVLPSQMHPEENDPDKVLSQHFSGDWVRYADALALQQRAEQAEAERDRVVAAGVSGLANMEKRAAEYKATRDDYGARLDKANVKICAVTSERDEFSVELNGWKSQAELQNKKNLRLTHERDEARRQVQIMQTQGSTSRLLPCGECEEKDKQAAGLDRIIQAQGVDFLEQQKEIAALIKERDEARRELEQTNLSHQTTLLALKHAETDRHELWQELESYKQAAIDGSILHKEDKDALKAAHAQIAALRDLVSRIINRHTGIWRKTEAEQMLSDTAPAAEAHDAAVRRAALKEVEGIINDHLRPDRADDIIAEIRQLAEEGGGE